MYPLGCLLTINRFAALTGESDIEKVKDTLHEVRYLKKIKLIESDTESYSSVGFSVRWAKSKINGYFYITLSILR
jgi:hypothetical protein